MRGEEVVLEEIAKRLDKLISVSGISFTDVVDNRNLLPTTLGDPVIGSLYLVQSPVKILLGTVTQYPAGIYTKMTDTGSLSDWVVVPVQFDFSDNNFLLYDDGNGAKQAKFELSNLTQLRILTLQDKDGTITLHGDNISLFTNDAGYQANVQSDWNQTSTGADDYIKNKPTDITDLSSHSVTELNDVTDAGSGEIITGTERTKLSGIEAGAQVNQTDAEIKTQYENNADTNAFTDAEKTKLGNVNVNAEENVQSDWSQTDTGADDYIKNKPTISGGTVSQSYAFTRNNSEFVQEGGTDVVAKITYAGSTTLGIPTNIIANVWNDGGTSVDITITDETNSNQIAQLLGITSSSEENIADLGTLSNIPLANAVISITLTLNGGGMGDDARISSLTIY